MYLLELVLEPHIGWVLRRRQLLHEFIGAGSLVQRYDYRAHGSFRQPGRVSRQAIPAIKIRELLAARPQNFFYPLFPCIEFAFQYWCYDYSHNACLFRECSDGRQSMIGGIVPLPFFAQQWHAI
jgi:hypothetical protein